MRDSACSASICPAVTPWGHGDEFTYYSNQVLVSPNGSTAVVGAWNRGDWFAVKTLAEEIYCAAVPST